MTASSIATFYVVAASLSDNGLPNGRGLAALFAPALAIPGVTPIPNPAEGYDDGRFSDGPVFAETAASLLGAGNVENFAIGSARAQGELVINDFLAPEEQLPFPSFNQNINLTGQIDQFLQAVTVAPPPANSVANILIGQLDFFDLGALDPATAIAAIPTTIDGIVTSISQAAITLSAAGVGTIAVNTLLPATFFPAFAAFPAELQPFADDAVAALNGALKLAAAELNTLGVNVVIIDTAAIAAEVAADATSFNILSLDQSILIGDGTTNVPNPFAIDPEFTGFYDSIHPTTELAGVFGAFVEASLTSEVTNLGDGNDFDVLSRADDLVLAGAGNDTLFLRSGEDVAIAGLGNDTVYAGGGSDIVSGGSGNDTVFGGSSGDILAGADGDDVLFGGTGDDLLSGGLGDDVLFGGRGDDVFLFTDPAVLGGDRGDHDVVFGGWGHDTLIVRIADEATLATEQAALDASGSRYYYEFVTLNLQIFGVEEVILTTDRGVPVDFDLSHDLEPIIDEAEAWNFI